MPSPYSYSLAALGGVQSSTVQAIVATSLYGLALGADGDLELDETGALRWTDGIEQATQESNCRCDYFLGEYFLDTREGLPYFRDVFVKNPNKETVTAMYRRTIASVPGLYEPNVLYNLNIPLRELNITWTAKWVDGTAVPPQSLKVLI